MTKMIRQPNPAEEASELALNKVYHCLKYDQNFLLEAGAGAGKTYALIKTLKFLIRRDEHKLTKRHQKIACITFTNVAKNEIEDRTDRNPVIYCGTIHAFCWSLISRFQKQIKNQLPEIETWSEKMREENVENINNHIIEYSLGHRDIENNHISIHHDDVLLLTVNLMQNKRFRHIVAHKYPIILIDEYQDTNADWVESIKKFFLGQNNSPLFGFFGDHWQKIYGDGCGKIEHPSLTVIKKEANFRSVSTIVDCLNRMRPELLQRVANPNQEGSVRIFHSNCWNGKRRTGNHWRGDLPEDVANHAFEYVKNNLERDGWEFFPEKTKILMLTHRGLASKQGYNSLPYIFSFNDSFTKKEHPHIAFFINVMEPACEAYNSQMYGKMFRALGRNIPTIRNQNDKREWSEAMDLLFQLREEGTVGDVISHLRQTKRPRLPDSVEYNEQKLKRFDPDSGEDIPRVLKEIEEMHGVQYREIIALSRYLSGHSPFQTKHGVKGAEFDNVLVIVGRGWNKYNFNEMLELAKNHFYTTDKEREKFERNRNLFYVVCSRPKKRLAILFTQLLSDTAMATVEDWFGSEVIEELELQW